MNKFSASVIVLLVATAALPWYAEASSLTPQEECGRRIYYTGTSPSGRPIVAYFGRDLLEVPGESATCASCHGHDGLGRAESGVLPSNITWQHLMKSYGHIHPGGTKHSPFSEQSLKTYLQDGLLPGGIAGNPTMPVYDISDEDLLDLLAFNKRLGSYQDPGLTESAIRIGMIMPAQGAAAELGASMQATVRAWFDEINSRGGVYGRSLELVTLKTGVSPEPSSKLRASLEQTEPFAVLSSVTPELEREMETLAEALHIPLVVPITMFPPHNPSNHRYVFHLHADFRQQMQVLAMAAARHTVPAEPRIAVIFPHNEGVEQAVTAAEAVFRDRGWQRVTRMEYANGVFDPPAVIRRLNRDGADLVIFLGDEHDSEGFLRESESLQQIPYLYMAGVLIGKSLYHIPQKLKDRVWLVYPSLPDDRSGWGLAEFSSLAQRRNLAVTQKTAQIAAYVSAKVLVEALRRAGRHLSRERLIEVLEGMFEFDTGLTRPLSFGKNRRVGTFGAHIVAVDPARAGTAEYLIPQGWVSLK